MPMRSRQSWVPGAFVLAAVAVACSDRSRRPPTSPNLPVPSPVLSLELSGPGTVHVGQPAQFTVTGRQPDGTTRNVTRDVTWRFDTELLSMSTPGLLAGKSKGQGAIGVSFARLSATIGEVVVVPEGTFRLSGTVRDSGVLVDAIVRVESQALGQAEVAATGGQYVVFGVSGETTVTAIKDGYEQVKVTQLVSAHHTVDLDLALSQPRRDISGRYTLAITTGAPCIGPSQRCSSPGHRFAFTKEAS
jgi:hypothetical protein